MKMTEADKAILRDKLRRLDGEAPYNTPTNLDRADGYYARALERQYDATIEELRKLIQ